MNDIKALTLLELRSLCGINRLLYTKDKKEKKRYKLLISAFIILILFAVGYVSGMVFGLSYLGLGDIIPTYLVMIASLIVIILGIFRSGNTLFSKNGYEMLVSIPIRTKAIVISRFSLMYTEYLSLSLLVMLPGIITFGILQQPNPSFYILALLCTFFIPLIPLVISILLGTLTFAISSRLKHKSIVQSILTVAVILGVFLLLFSIQSLTDSFSEEKLTEFARSATELFAKIYPFAVLLGTAMMNGGLAEALLFMLISSALTAIAVLVVSLCFHKIMSALHSFSAKHSYKIEDMQSKSILSTLYFKEIKRYFSSSVYVTNTIVGPILGCIFAITLLIIGKETIQSSIPLPIDVLGLIPFVYSAICCLMPTSSTSISMEGKRIELIKSLPISAKELFDSKLLLNLTLLLPSYVISEIVLIIALKPTFTELIWLILIPLIIMLFSVTFGITADLIFRNFNWEKEEAVVKQGASAALGGFGGMLASMILGILTAIAPENMQTFVKAGVCILLASLTFILYRNNNKHSLSEL